MQLGLGIILSLLVLLPGFGLYGSIFTKHGSKGLDPIPPKPSSISTLVIIAIGAILGHLFLATLTILYVMWCSLTPFHFAHETYPDLYQYLGRTPNSYSAFSVFILLIIDIVITMLVFLFGKFLARFGPTKQLVSRLRYGALSSLLTKIEPENRFATAFVLTMIERDDQTDDPDIIGYEGVLDDLIYDKSEIQAVQLSDCTPFYLRREKDSLTKIDINKDKKNIPFLYFPKDEIRNISFTVFENQEGNETTENP